MRHTSVAAAVVALEASTTTSHLCLRLGWLAPLDLRLRVFWPVDGEERKPAIPLSKLSERFLVGISAGELLGEH